MNHKEIFQKTARGFGYYSGKMLNPPIPKSLSPDKLTIESNKTDLLPKLNTISEQFSTEHRQLKILDDVLTNKSYNPKLKRLEGLLPLTNDQIDLVENLRQDETVHFSGHNQSYSQATFFNKPDRRSRDSICKVNAKIEIEDETIDVTDKNQKTKVPFAVASVGKFAELSKGELVKECCGSKHYFSKKLNLKVFENNKEKRYCFKDDSTGIPVSQNDMTSIIISNAKVFIQRGVTGIGSIVTLPKKEFVKQSRRNIINVFNGQKFFIDEELGIKAYLRHSEATTVYKFDFNKFRSEIIEYKQLKEQAQKATQSGRTTALILDKISEAIDLKGEKLDLDITDFFHEGDGIPNWEKSNVIFEKIKAAILKLELKIECKIEKKPLLHSKAYYIKLSLRSLING